MSSPSENKTPAVTEPEYEWGVQYYGPDGFIISFWGFNEDPRTSGAIDQFGHVEIDENSTLAYHSAIAVGKRIKVTIPEDWESI